MLWGVLDTQNIQMFKEFSIINSKMCEEIERLKNENRILKENANK